MTTSASPSNASAFPRQHFLRARMLRLVTSTSSVTLVDQVTVSAANFLTTILIGRIAGPDALGIYAIVFSISVMLLAAQESLVCLPYAIQFRRIPKVRRQRYAGSSLVQASLLAMLITPMLLLSGLATSIFTTDDGSMTAALIAMGIAMPMVLLRDFGRRFSLAHLRPHVALGIDLAATILQLALLLVAAWFGWLNASTAVMTIGLGCALAGGAWLIASRQAFAVRRRQLRGDTLRNWRLGKWVFASHLCSIINCYCVHWLIIWMMGPGPAGLFVGCTAVVQMASPFILGMHNLLSPQIAAADAESGNAGIRKVLIPATIVMAVVMSMFSVGIMLFGEWLTIGIYGEQFAGHHLTTVLFAIGVCSATIGMPADRVLWIAKQPAASFRTALIGLVVTLITTVALIPRVGIVAGAVGILAGYLVTALARWFALWHLGVLSEARA